LTETRAETPERGRPGNQDERKNIFARITLFYRQVIAELRKVVRPTRKELLTYTTVVIVFVLVVIAYVSILDYGFGQAVLSIFG
jgi:preprotein translocase subunit SecE